MLEADPPVLVEPTGEEGTHFARPASTIGRGAVERLLRAGVDPMVAEIDLESVKFSLLIRRGWRAAFCDLVEVEYKRHLSLKLWNPWLKHPIIPTEVVDIAWHEHILDTRAYVTDTEKVFGHYVHHFPYIGIGSQRSRELKTEAFHQSEELYRMTFGEPRAAVIRYVDGLSDRPS